MNSPKTFNQMDRLIEENKRLQTQFAEVLGKLQQVHRAAVSASKSSGSYLENNWLAEFTATPYPDPLEIKPAACEPIKDRLSRLVDAFLAWPLPSNLGCDQCATERFYPHPRSGTNLLNAEEARQMFNDVLSKCSLEIRDSGDPEKECTTFGIPTRVLEAIHSERSYQEAKWPGHDHTISGWGLIMQRCLNAARDGWERTYGDEQALHEIRQVAASGIAAMEKWGSPLRETPEGRVMTMHARGGREPSTAGPVSLGAQNAALRDALQATHNKLSECCHVFFEQDGKPVGGSVDLGEAYQESSLCNRVLNVLRA